MFQSHGLIDLRERSRKGSKQPLRSLGPAAGEALINGWTQHRSPRSTERARRRSCSTSCLPNSVVLSREWGNGLWGLLLGIKP